MIIVVGVLEKVLKGMEMFHNHNAMCEIDM